MGLIGKKNIIGVDVGSKSTKIASLKFSGGQANLVDCIYVPTGTKDSSFVSNLKSTISDFKLKGMTAAMSFDDPSMIIRKMELPKMPTNDLLEAMRWNLRDHADGDLAEYHVSYSPLSDQKNNDADIMELVVYAVKIPAVEKFKSEMDQIGVNVQWIEPESVTLASTLDRVVQDDEGYLCGVDIGASHSLFYVIGKRLFLFSRPMQGITLAMHEKSPEEFPQKLAIEIQKSIDTFQVNFQMQNLSKLYLSGGGALIENLDTYLETNMGMKTEVLNPFATLIGSENFSEQKSQLFAKAVGLAYVSL